MNKNILLPGIVGITVLACLFAVNANFGAMKQNLNRERSNRLEAELKLDAETKNSRRLSEQLSDAKQRLERIESIVSEGQSTTSQLKSTVEMAEKENESLKAAVKKLQDELAASQKIAAERAAALSAVTPPAAAN